MKLIKQPNGWTCGPASLAMFLDIPYEQVIAELGHDGSEIIRPDLGDPKNRRGFHIQEFIDVADRYGWAFMEIEAEPVSHLGAPGTEYYLDVNPDARITYYMNKYSGLIIGEYAPDRLHMCAWNHEEQTVYDPKEPKAYRFGLDSIAVYVFVAGIKSKTGTAKFFHT